MTGDWVQKECRKRSLGAPTRAPSGTRYGRNGSCWAPNGPQITMKIKKGTRTKHKGHKGDSNGLPPRRNTDPQTAGQQWAPKGEKANRRPPRIRANLGASTISQPPSAHEACARPKRHQRNELQGDPKNTKIPGPRPNPKGKATHIPKTKNVRQILTPYCKAALTNV